MTHQTNEELREKIASIVKDVRRETDGHYDAVDEIMSIIEPIIKERDELKDLARLALEHAFNGRRKNEQ